MNENSLSATSMGTAPSASLPRPPLRCDKITPRHLEGLAMVYVRQSSPQQLIRNQESTQIQYNLRARAAQLGWPLEQIQIVDDDQGQSAASAENRRGFQHVVSEVSLGHVGIVLGVETSRLARSCDDWYPLLKVCSVFGTLIGDLDGVYDPGQYNDRLLLGLKGTMSEAELHILKQRLHQGQLNKARRGELRFNLPLGYVRRPSGEAAFDPDEQAQEVVRLIFRKFRELGTLNGVLQFFVRHGVKLPFRVREGAAKGDLQWRRPNRVTLRLVLKNPMYAGAYAYGRRGTPSRGRGPAGSRVRRREIPLEECPVLLKDRVPAYISWEEYESHRERLRANRARADAVGAPKHGPSLLAGLVVCGKCQGRMGVWYPTGRTRHTYECSRLKTQYGEPPCQRVTGSALDELVTEQVLRALEPAGLELSLEAARNIERQREELGTLWRTRLERARYDVERSARQYHHVEPENRLVARHLEREWEEKLRAHRQLEEEHERWRREQPRLLSAEERDAIRKLAGDIPTLWKGPRTTDADRKEILRQVVDRVTVEAVGQSERVIVAIHWAGATRTLHEMVRPVPRVEQLSYWPALEQRIRKGASEGLGARQIAERLHREGWRPPKPRERFGPEGIRLILRRLGVMSRAYESREPADLGPNECSLPSLARELSMSASRLSQWVARGWVKGRRSPQGRWILEVTPEDRSRLRELRNLPRGYHARQVWLETTQARKINS